LPAEAGRRPAARCATLGGLRALPRGRAAVSRERLPGTGELEPAPCEPAQALPGEGPELEPVALEIGPELDLHLFAPRDLRRALEGYLEAAAALGLREVRVVHGKGKGAARAAAQQLLARSPWVASFRDAPPERGGWGATLALLRVPGAGSPG
jgi:hypothetical protein